MALYARLMGSEQPKLAVHSLMALLAEHLGRGRLTRAEVDAWLELTAAEQGELTTLIGTFNGTALGKLSRALEVHDVLLLAEQRRPPYDTEAAIKARLGV